MSDVGETTGEPEKYPPYVATPEQKKRWDYAEGIAKQFFEDAGVAAVWGATRAIYADPELPTE